MEHINKNKSRALKPYLFMLIVMLVWSLIWVSFSPQAALAGKEGVFINNSVYFTLEDATLSAGSDSQMLSFTVRLNNNGDSQIDYNYFGVRVTSTNGGSYSAQLSQKGEGLVSPFSTADYAYVSKIPAGLTADQLKVTIFNRNGGGMNDLGSLSVANVSSLRQLDNQLLLNLSDVDGSAPSDAWVSFQVMRAFAEPKGGKWTITVDVAAEYTGTGTVSLPTALKMTLKDKTGKSYVTTANMVDGTSLGTGHTSHLILTAAADVQPDVSNFMLELARPDASGTVLGKLNIGPRFAVVPAGQRVPYVLQGSKGLSVELEHVQLHRQTDSQQVLVSVLFHNDSDHTVQLPAFTGTLVSPVNSLSIDAELVLPPDPYVASGKSAAYRFAADVPDSVNADDLQILISEQKAVKTAAAANGSNGNSGASANSGASGSASQADASSTAIPVMAASLQGALASSGGVSASPYVIGQPMKFDPASSLIDPNLEVSVVELNAHTNDDNGYQTAIAKFKFVNKSSSTLALPAFSTELVDASGVSYPGVRQTTALQQLIPNTAYVISYSYLLPPMSEGTYTLNILDTSNTSKYKVPISSNQVTFKPFVDNNTNFAVRDLSFYPFNVKIEDWRVAQTYSGGSYTYKLNLIMDIQKIDPVIVDETFSTMEFDLVDSQNRLLGSTSMPFIGANKLVSGNQTINFTNIRTEQFEYPVTINVYETIQTQSGPAKRLVATLKQ